DAQLHQYPPPHVWRIVSLGLRAERTGVQRPRGRAIDIQQHRTAACFSTAGPRTRIHAGGSSASIPSGGATDSRPGGLVSAVPGISPLLPKPQTLLARVFASAGRAAVSEALKCARDPLVSARVVASGDSPRQLQDRSDRTGRS